MSSITFQARDGVLGTVSVAERARGLELAVDTAADVLGCGDDAGATRLLWTGAIPQDSMAAVMWNQLGTPPSEAVRSWLRDMTGCVTVEIDGETVPMTHAVLNTAAVEGPNPIAFLARLHGSVEDGLWVKGEHTAWLADVLSAGVREGHLTDGDGWTALIKALARSSGPVVITSSQGMDVSELGEGPDAAAWWLQITPENLRQPAYAPLKTLHGYAESA